MSNLHNKRVITSEESKRRCNILNTYISEFKGKHPYLSSNQIANKLGIPQSSLNRIENQTTNPSLENILNIMVGTGNRGKIPEVLNIIFPSQKEKFDLIFSQNKETPFLDEVSVGYATRDDTFLIMQMAFTRSGVTISEIREKFGHYGLDKLDLLMEEGILHKREDGTIGVNEEKANASFADLKKMLLMAIDKCYQPDSHDKAGAHLSYQTESVNSEGFRAILDELKTVQAKIRRILYNPQYYGDLKVFVGMVSDQIIKNKYDDEKLEK